jgi:hypothetical protein
VRCHDDLHHKCRTRPENTEPTVPTRANTFPEHPLPTAELEPRHQTSSLQFVVFALQVRGGCNRWSLTSARSCGLSNSALCGTDENEELT